MNILKLYKIDINYIKYLYSFDKRVQYNPNREDSYTAKRPYLGIVLNVENFKYFVPLEHPRLNHRNMKNNTYILKIHNGKYGILGFNNMIPVEEKYLINFDINNEKDTYRQILVSQHRFCNKHIREIEEKAKSTYQKSQKNRFFKKVCCNFKLLEEKCIEYKGK